MDSCFFLKTGTRIPKQIHTLTDNEIVCNFLRHSDTSVQFGRLIEFQSVLGIGICEVDNEAEGGGIRPIVLYLGLVLRSDGPVYFLVNEALHSVQVEDVADNGVARVRQHFAGQRFVEVAQVGQVK